MQFNKQNESWVVVDRTICKELPGKVSKLCIADLTTSDLPEPEVLVYMNLMKEAPNLLKVLMEIEYELKRPGTRSVADLQRLQLKAEYAISLCPEKWVSSLSVPAPRKMKSVR